MKKPATWQFLTLAVLLMALGGGVTYWVQLVKMKAQFAARVPDRPAAMAEDLGGEVASLEQRIRAGDALAVGELGKLYQTNEYFEPALSCFAKMTSLDPTNLNWGIDLATMELAVGKQREAKTRVTRLRMQGLPDGESYWRLGNLAEALGEQVDAKEDYQRAVELDPSLIPAWNRLITMYQLTGRTPEARTAFEVALEANPDAFELILHRATFLADNQQLEPALSDLKRVMILAPENEFAYLLAARLLMQMGRGSEAEDALISLLTRDSENLNALQQLMVMALASEDRLATDRWYRRLVGQADDGTLSSILDERSAELFAKKYQQLFGELPPK